MCHRLRTTSITNRSGYTLMELLLAMTVLLAVAGIVWPVMQGQHARYLLKNDVEDVRRVLAGTRIRAIDFGLIYQFLYEPGGRNFLVVPYEGLETEGAQVDSGSAPLYRFSGIISENAYFEYTDDPSLATDEDSLVGSISEDFLSGLSNSLELSTVSWSSPILFYPDGSAMSGAFEVRDDKRQIVRISVRELTGAVKVDSLRYQETR